MATVKSKDIKFDYISPIHKTKYFKITNPFIWKVHLVTGFYRTISGIFGWTCEELQLNNRTFPISDEQLIELKKRRNML
jgi:hypothetical protein